MGRASRNLLSLLIVALSTVSTLAADLAFKYPSHPEADVDVTLSWSGGVSPVRVLSRLVAVRHQFARSLTAVSSCPVVISSRLL